MLIGLINVCGVVFSLLNNLKKRRANSMKKSILLALALVVTMAASPLAARADEWSLDSAGDLLSWVISLPVKVVNDAVGDKTGVVVGTLTGFVKGVKEGTKSVAGALGDENGATESLVGLAVGGPIGGTVQGVVDGLTW